MEQPEQNIVTNLPRLKPAAQQQAERAPGALIFDVKNVSIWYSAFKAVMDVSLPIYEHEITAFIGSSGSGKTTVLRSFNRMNDLVPGARLEGEIYYRGESLYGRDVSPIAVRLPSAWSSRSRTRSEVDLRQRRLRAAHQRRAQQAQAGRIVEHSLHQAALWDEVKNRLNKSGLSLSGGQAQRLCLAARSPSSRTSS